MPDTTLLFVGGSLDGKRMPIPDSMSRYRSAAQEMYERMKIAGDSSVYSVFKLDWASPDSVMKALVDGYVVESQMKEERDALAEAIANAAIQAGIINKGIPLTGPHLILLCENLAMAASHRVLPFDA